MVARKNMLLEMEREFYNELVRANHIIGDIVGVLDSLNDNSNLTKDIGIFARQMPEFKILGKKAYELKMQIRKICTGEVLVQEARWKAMNIQRDIKEALEGFRKEKLFPEK